MHWGLHLELEAWLHCALTRHNRKMGSYDQIFSYGEEEWGKIRPMSLHHSEMSCQLNLFCLILCLSRIFILTCSCLPWHLWALFKGIWRSDPISGQIQVSQLSGNWQSAKTSKHLGRKLRNLFRLKKQLNLSLTHPGLVVSPLLYTKDVQIKALLQNKILLLLLKGTSQQCLS